MATLFAASAAASASAPIDWRVCGGARDFACGRLAVPLDPSGSVPGTVSLAIRRRRAPVGDAKVAIVGLAGGPGQAAIPFAAEMAQLLGPAVDTRDLIVYDQRGTGESGPLKCKALGQITFGSLSPASTIGHCASELGTARNFYATSDTVADIEAIRQAGGYSKLIIYGTSYGTWVAMAYARAYPQHTAGLILDSTLPPSGPDLFNGETFAALPHVLADLCSGGACAHITSTPYRDLVDLITRMRAAEAPLSARVYDGRGHAHVIDISESEILDLLVGGDLDLTLRAEFPAAVRSALAGDTAPLGALIVRANVASATDASVDDTLYYATSCEDDPFPWDRTATQQQRLIDATQALDRLPKDAFAPFDLETALSLSNAPQCIGWPSAGRGPGSAEDAAVAAAARPLPDVPTLIFSGDADLRTPTENARAVVKQIPGAVLVVVKHAGHSVLSHSPGDCAEQALRAFFAKRAEPSCADSPRGPLDAPTPIAPRTLAAVPGLPAQPDRAGRTATAVKLTLRQISRNLLRLLDSGGGSAAAGAVYFGGLRGGYFTIATRAGIALHDYSYVPGVTVTGTLRPGSLLTIAGSAAAAGSLRVSADESLVGTLGGESVDVR